LILAILEYLCIANFSVMEKIETTIGSVKTLIIGPKSEKVYLFIHGNSGSKEEAIPFAELAVPKGYQVIGIDLPVMGKPWNVLGMIDDVKNYLKKNYSSISIRSNSIGSFYTLMAFQSENVDKALLVSPILDMKTYIDEKSVKENIKDGEYYRFICNNPIDSWNAETHILRPDVDLIVPEAVYDHFISRHECTVSVMEGGEHWFHTEEQLAVLKEWEEAHI